MKRYLRPWKTRLFEETERRIKCRQRPAIVSLHDVCLTPLGQLYDESLRRRDDMIFEDTGFCAQVSHYQECGTTIEKAVYGGYIRKKWGHFITETLARMWVLEALKAKEYDKILFFSDSESVSIPDGNYKQIFELLGIVDKIIVVADKVNVKQLIVPELGYEHDIFYTKEQADVYKKIVENALQIKPSIISAADKVFISRTKISGALRDAINLKELEEYFSKNGFKTIIPEQTSIIDLIHIMDCAHTIATISGSPAHNYAFVRNPSSKRMVIIERHAWINEFQISLNKMTECETVNVDAYYLPRPASSQDGLMLFAPTPQFCKFASELGLSDNGRFVGGNRRRRHHELRRFISRYRRYWCSGDALCEWEEGSGQSIAESIVASRERYAEWLRDGLPLMWYDYLSPRPLVRLLLYKLRFRTI